jgi:hypothetical protein
MQKTCKSLAECDRRELKVFDAVINAEPTRWLTLLKLEMNRTLRLVWSNKITACGFER